MRTNLKLQDKTLSATPQGTPTARNFVSVLKLTVTTAGILVGVASCNKSAPVQKVDASHPSITIRVTNEPVRDMIKITIGSKTFTATLEDNPTVAKLKALLPLTLNMTELNGNEKYYRLSTRLPTDEISPGTIRSGDLMLYGNNSLVLSYKTFETSYTYTRLGRIDDPSGLAAAVGPGEVSVTFEFE